MDGTRKTRFGGRRNGFRGAFLALSACFLAALPGWSALAQGTLESSLRSVLAALPDPDTQVGACVINLSTNRMVFADRADTSMIPASTMKLPVMAAALADLGPDFAFDTVLATDGTNLVVIGDGDPAIGDEKVHRLRREPITADFQRWARALLDQGISVIPGDLVIDASIFDDTWLHPSWEEEDLGKWYAAPVGGLNFNGNCVDLTASPGSKPGAPAIITAVPETTVIQIVNRCRTGTGRNPVVHHPPGTFEYIVSGRCAKPWAFVSVAFPDPGLLFADSLRTALHKEGIHVAGTIRRQRVRSSEGDVPPSFTMLGHRYTAVAEVLSRIGKNSQNLFAECLLKRTGYAWARRQGTGASAPKPAADMSGDRGPRGTWATGARAVEAFMTRAGIDTGGLAVVDGSGLSRENRCTARQLAALLAWMHGQRGGQMLRDSLSVAGVDGSLRKHLRDIPGRVHAKTGTMRSVRALAGYVDGETGPRYAFAVIFNGYQGSSAPYKRLCDQFCRVLAAAAVAAPDGP
jgi:D-alanyl-D-alanine carboxypeptidase/D-alanyl-D-alanine-endopeptidase (penicillin-binding protein 4)